MKKIDKELEEKLSKELENYYNDIEVPELSDEKKAEFHKLIEQNKPKRKKMTLWKRITAVASAMCLIALIIIPTVILLNKNDNPENPPAPPPIYYGKAEAIKITHDLLETQEIVNTNFPKYNFMFTDLNYISSKGYYHPENNTLLAIQINFSEKEIPLPVEIHLIASKQFVYDDKEIYTKNAEYTETQNYKQYKKNDEFQLGYIIYDNHEIFIYLERINEELFNKFI